ncbi:MAG: pyridoxamine 5'-phosphate oxidase family protein [Aggregatilineales bacterium]
MPTKQGPVNLLDDPVAQGLLQSKIPARLAYVWKDGTPRVIPIGFHWDGKDIVLGTPPNAPKMKVIDGAKVALTIDSDTMPHKVLYIRGTAHVTIVDGIVPEYALMSKRVMGPEGGAAWLKQIEPMSPKMARIAIRPEWVGILDFEHRFPSAIEKAMGM